jgi:hypothetical protein
MDTIDEIEQSIEYYLANYLNEVFNNMLLLDPNTLCSDIVNEYIRFHKKYYDRVPMNKVFDMQLYDWYYGNVINKIIVLIFQPYLYEQENTSKEQAHDALSTCYLLINEHGCSCDIPDYYGITPLAYVNDQTNEMKTNKNKKIPSYINEIVPAFKFILRNGPQCILIQQNMIRVWLKRHVERRKKAVQVFEKRWLEILYNPYTRVGSNHIKNIESHFYSLALAS